MILAWAMYKREELEQVNDELWGQEVRRLQIRLRFTAYKQRHGCIWAQVITMIIE